MLQSLVESVSMAVFPQPVVVVPSRGKALNPRWSLCSLSSDSKQKQRVKNAVLKQAAMMEEKMRVDAALMEEKMRVDAALEAAYDRCHGVCLEYSKTFYWGTLLMTPRRRRAIWALDVWCRRTDELVDGHNAPNMAPYALDQWEARLEDLFAGRPYDMFDAALSDTVSTFSIDIRPFKDMIEGMRMDLNKSRYKNFDELHHYCYLVAGTVALMSIPIMGVAPGSSAIRGRIYIPQDELAKADLSDDDVFNGKVTDKWRSLMKDQIARARMFYREAEAGITMLHQASRCPVLASLLLYRQILDEIEANDYNNFTKRASVSKAKKLMTLPLAYARSLRIPLL